MVRLLSRHAKVQSLVFWKTPRLTGNNSTMSGMRMLSLEQQNSEEEAQIQYKNAVAVWN